MIQSLENNKETILKRDKKKLYTTQTKLQSNHLFLPQKSFSQVQAGIFPAPHKRTAFGRGEVEKSCRHWRDPTKAAFFCSRIII